MPRAPSGLNVVSGIFRTLVDLADVRVDWNVVIRKILVDRATVDRVDVSLLVERERHPPYDASDELVEAGRCVHQGSDIVGADDAPDFDHEGVAVDGNLGKDGPEGV